MQLQSLLSQTCTLALAFSPASLNLRASVHRNVTKIPMMHGGRVNTEMRSLGPVTIAGLQWKVPEHKTTHHSLIFPCLLPLHYWYERREQEVALINTVCARETEREDEKANDKRPASESLKKKKIKAGRRCLDTACGREVTSEVACIKQNSTFYFLMRHRGGINASTVCENHNLGKNGHMLPGLRVKLHLFAGAKSGYCRFGYIVMKMQTLTQVCIL